MSLAKKLQELKEAFEGKLLSDDEHKAQRDILLKTFVAEGPSVNGASDLTKFLERKDLRERHAWKRSQETARDVILRASAAFSVADAFGTLGEQFRSRAEAGLLGAMEVMLASYALFASDPESGRFLLAYLLVHVPEKQRLQVHNWNVANDMPESWVEANGDGIANLQLPLFPRSCVVLNEKVLAIGAGLLSGGGQQVDSIFRPSTTLWSLEQKPKQKKALEAKHHEVLLGGGYAVQVDANGMVELSVIENAFNELSSRLALVERARAPPPQYNKRGGDVVGGGSVVAAFVEERSRTPGVSTPRPL